MPKFLKSWQIYPLQFIVVHRFLEGQERPTLVLALRWVAFMVPNILWLRRDRQTDRQADKQTDRQRDIPMDTPTNGRAHRHIHGRTDRQANKQTDKYTDIQADNRQTDGRLDGRTVGQRDTKIETQKTNRQTRQDRRTDGHMDRRRDRYNGCPPTTTRLLPHASAQRCAQNIDLLPPRLACKWVLSSFGSCSSQNITNQHFEVSNVLCRVPASKSHPL